MAAALKFRTFPPNHQAKRREEKRREEKRREEKRQYTKERKKK